MSFYRGQEHRPAAHLRGSVFLSGSNLIGDCSGTTDHGANVSARASDQRGDGADVGTFEAQAIHALGFFSIRRIWFS